MSFELDQARLDLELTKEMLKKYLVESYGKQDNYELLANRTFKVFETQVDNICKRRPVAFDFGPGADPLWYEEIFSKFVKWVSLELRIADLLGQELDSYLQ